MIWTMMNYLTIILFCVSCAQLKPKPVPNDDLVSVHAALNHAQASYLKGCVDAMKELKIPITFPGCRDKALLHRQELDSIMSQEVEW